MNNSQNLSGLRYGAFELKAKYRRNMLMGTMISAFLAMATTAGAFLFTQSEPAPVIFERDSKPDSIIVDLSKKYDIKSEQPKFKGHTRPTLNTKGSNIVMVTDDEPFDEDVRVFSLTDRYSTGPTGDDTGEVSSYIDNPGYGYGGDRSGDYPEPDKPVYVDKMPDMIYEFKPDYPRLAMVAGMEASVWIKALVDIDGSVRDAMIFVSSNSKAGFDDEALRAAYKCKYKPAIHDGRPVPIWVSYKVEFVLEDSR